MAQTDVKIPLVILGGSDRKSVQLPPDASRQHALTGYKGVDIRLEGRCLISHLIELYEQSEGFEPVIIAGPAEVYRTAVDRVPIIDTDRQVGQNVRVAMEALRGPHPGPLAFTTCDILPRVAELKALLAEYHQGPSPAAWYPLIRVPDEPGRLGASGWKPKYHVVPERGAAPVAVLPSHLVIIDPSTLRLRFLYRLLDAAYRTRNRPIPTRRTTMLLQSILGLVYQDFRLLFTFHPPTLTWTVVKNGLRLARHLREGTITRNELERRVGRILLRRLHRRRHPERGVRTPIVDALSLALDADTEEEARQLQKEMRGEIRGQAP